MPAAIRQILTVIIITLKSKCTRFRLSLKVLNSLPQGEDFDGILFKVLFTF